MIEPEPHVAIYGHLYLTGSARERVRDHTIFDHREKRAKMRGAAIIPVCGLEAPEILEPRARTRASCLELSSLLTLMHACCIAAFSNGGVSALSR